MSDQTPPPSWELLGLLALFLANLGDWSIRMAQAINKRGGGGDAGGSCASGEIVPRDVYLKLERLQSELTGQHKDQVRDVLDALDRLAGEIKERDRRLQ